MKKSLLFIAVLLGINSNAQTGPSFTITNVSGTNSITCSHTSLNYVANGAPSLTYLWVSSNATLSGSSVNITVPGNYSVTAIDTLSNSSVKMLSVLINTVLPVSTVSPNIQSITCSSPTAQFIILVSPTPGSSPANQTQSITSQYGAPYVLNSNASFIYQASAPGTYTYLQVDNNNGCSALKNFTVTSTSGFPTYNITSPQNFTLGCGTKSAAVINIVNAQTTPTPGGVISYSLIGPFGSTSSYTLTTPGTYTVVVKDNTTNCETRTPFTLIQNTISPAISVSVPSQILDCHTPKVKLQASSSTPNVSYNWAFMGTPGNLPTDTISVRTNTIAFTSTLVNSYTLSITDNNNACKSFTVIPMVQNIFPPNTNISSGGNSTLTCQTPTISLTNISTTGIPPSTGFPSSMPVIGFLWEGPTPLLPASNSSTYIASVAGIYTLTGKDLNNGCSSKKTIQIFDDCNLVGIHKNVEKNNSYSLFPNPNNGLFSINSNAEIGNQKIEIYNMLGDLIKSEKLSSEKTDMDIQEASKGIYILQVTENGKVIYSTKFIKH